MGRLKLLQKKILWGLLRTKHIVCEQESVFGPDKEEICIVTDEYMEDSNKYYILAGYPFGGYDSKRFIRLDEFTETQKEIAEKSELVLN